MRAESLVVQLLEALQQFELDVGELDAIAPFATVTARVAARLARALACQGCRSPVVLVE